MMLINEVNTILALTNKPAKKNEFGILQNIAFASLQKRIIKETEIKKYKIIKI